MHGKKIQSRLVTCRFCNQKMSFVFLREYKTNKNKDHLFLRACETVPVSVSALFMMSGRSFQSAKSRQWGHMTHFVIICKFCLDFHKNVILTKQKRNLKCMYNYGLNFHSYSPKYGYFFTKRQCIPMQPNFAYQNARIILKMKSYLHRGWN